MDDILHALKHDVAISDEWLASLVDCLKPLESLKGDVSKKELRSLAPKYGSFLITLVKSSLVWLQREEREGKKEEVSIVIRAVIHGLTMTRRISACLSSKPLALETFSCQLIGRCVDHKEYTKALEEGISLSKCLVQEMGGGGQLSISLRNVGYTLHVPLPENVADPGANNLPNLMIVFLYNICQCLFHDGSETSLQQIANIIQDYVLPWVKLQVSIDEAVAKEKIKSIWSLLWSTGIKLEQVSSKISACNCFHQGLALFTATRITSFIPYFLDNAIKCVQRCSSNVTIEDGASTEGVSRNVQAVLSYCHHIEKENTALCSQLFAEYSWLLLSCSDFFLRINSPVKALSVALNCAAFTSATIKTNGNTAENWNLKIYQGLAHMRCTQTLLSTVEYGDFSDEENSNRVGKALTYFKSSATVASSFLSLPCSEESLTALGRYFTIVTTMKATISFLQGMKKIEVIEPASEWWIVAERYYSLLADIAAFAMGMEGSLGKTVSKSAKQSDRFPSRKIAALREAICVRFIRMRGCTEESSRLTVHVNTVNNYTSKVLSTMQSSDTSVEEIQGIASLVHNEGASCYSNKLFKSAGDLFRSSINLWEEVALRQEGPQSSVMEKAKLHWRFSLAATCFLKIDSKAAAIDMLCSSFVWHSLSPLSHTSSSSSSSTSSDDPSTTMTRLIENYAQSDASFLATNSIVDLIKSKFDRVKWTVSIDALPVVLKCLSVIFMKVLTKYIKSSKIDAACVVVKEYLCVLSHWLEITQCQIQRGHVLALKAHLIYTIAISPLKDSLPNYSLSAGASQIMESIDLLSKVPGSKGETGRTKHLHDYKGKSMMTLGIILYAMNDTAESMANFDAALSEWSLSMSEGYEFVDASDTSSSLVSIAAIFSLAQEKVRQLNALKLLVNINTAARFRDDTIAIFGLCHIGSLFHGLGYNEHAQSYYDRAYKLLSSAGINPSLPSSLDRNVNEVASDAVVLLLVKHSLLHLDTGGAPFKEGETLLNAAFSWLSSGDNTDDSGAMYNGALSKLKEIQGSPSFALAECITALNLRKRSVSSSVVPICDSGSVSSFAESLRQCGRLWEARGLPKKAEYFYKKGVDLASRVGSCALKKMFLESLGFLYCSWHRWEDAERAISASDAIIASSSSSSLPMGDSPGDISSLLMKGDLARLRNLPSEALAHYDNAESAVKLLMKDAIPSLYEEKTSMFEGFNKENISDANTTGKGKKAVKGSKPGKGKGKVAVDMCESPSHFIPVDAMWGKILVRRGKVLLSQGDFSSAAFVFDEAMVHHPDPLHKGLILFHQGQCMLEEARVSGELEMAWRVNDRSTLKGKSAVKVPKLDTARGKLREAYCLVRPYAIPELTRSISRALVIAQGFESPSMSEVKSKTTTIPSNFLMDISFGTTMQLEMLKQFSSSSTDTPVTMATDEDSIDDVTIKMEALIVSDEESNGNSGNNVSVGTPLLKLFSLDTDLSTAVELQSSTMKTIPSEWVLTSVCHSEGDLLISRRMANQDAVIIRLPNMQNTISTVSCKFADIMAGSAATLGGTANDVDPVEGSDLKPKAAFTSAQKKLWWDERDKLNKDLEKFLSEAQETLLGPWICMLRGAPSDGATQSKLEGLANRTFVKLLDIYGLEVHSRDRIRSEYILTLLLNACDCLSVRQFRQGVSVLVRENSFSVDCDDMIDSEGKSLATLAYTEALYLLKKEKGERKADSSRKEKVGVKKQAATAKSSSLREVVVDPKKLVVGKLREELEARGLPSNGLKADLVKRLTDAVARESEASEEPETISDDEEDASPVSDDHGRHSRRHPVILILGEGFQKLPWESMPALARDTISRMPSVLTVLAHVKRFQQHKNGTNSHTSSPPFRHSVDSHSAFCCINPSGDLVDTEKRLSPLITQLGWDQAASWVGKKPTSAQIKDSLLEYDIFLYCGHGSGDQYICRDTIESLPRAPVALLMGCSSGLLKEQGLYEPQGTPLSYIMAGSPTVVANLWDVTDADIDRFSETVLREWLLPHQDRHREQLSLLEAVTAARKSCKLRYLNGAAPVVYGIPSFAVHS